MVQNHSHPGPGTCSVSAVTMASPIARFDRIHLAAQAAAVAARVAAVAVVGGRRRELEQWRLAAGEDAEMAGSGLLAWAHMCLGCKPTSG